MLTAGLMDVGVGAFVFSSGISSRPAVANGSAKPPNSPRRSLQHNAVLLLGEACTLILDKTPLLAEATKLLVYYLILQNR